MRIRADIEELRRRYNKLQFRCGESSKAVRKIRRRMSRARRYMQKMETEAA